MKLDDYNGQIAVPSYVFKKNLSMAAMGVFTHMCGRVDLNVHKDTEIAEELGLELSDWFAVKVELVEAKLITSSPITDDYDEEMHKKHLEQVRQEISEME